MLRGRASPPMLFSFPVGSGTRLWCRGRVTALGQRVTGLLTPFTCVWVSWGQPCPWAAPASPVLAGACARRDGRQGPAMLSLCVPTSLGRHRYNRAEIRAWFIQEVLLASSGRFGQRSEAPADGNEEQGPQKASCMLLRELEQVPDPPHPRQHFAFTWGRPTVSQGTNSVCAP